MTPAADPARCIPILASLNLDETEAFTREQLGFVTVYRDGTYGIFRRGGMEIHYWLTADRNIAENTACYIRGGEITALYAEFAAREVSNLTEFKVRPWNMKEFYIVDPHGNLLKFGCAPEES